MNLPAYYSVKIPFTDQNATIWHPQDKLGPFSILTRGAFVNSGAAARWAYENIPGHVYSIVATSKESELIEQ